MVFAIQLTWRVHVLQVRLLLELMGNSLVRPSTALWLRNASGLLADLVTDPGAQRRRLPIVDLSHLRHRDRDRLEEVLAFYQERPQNFRVGYHWDQRYPAACRSTSSTSLPFHFCCA